MLRDLFPKQVVGNFTDGFSGPKSFRDVRETGPRSGKNENGLIKELNRGKSRGQDHSRRKRE